MQKQILLLGDSVRMQYRPLAARKPAGLSQVSCITIAIGLLKPEVRAISAQRLNVPSVYAAFGFGETKTPDALSLLQ